MWDSPEVNSFFLNVALVAIGLNISVMGYLTIYGPCVLGREIDLEEDIPAIVPIMAGSGVASFICLILAGWPIWGFLTPVYIMILFFGSTFSMVFMPSGHLGNLVFWAALIGCGYYAYSLDHKPDW